MWTEPDWSATSRQRSSTESLACPCPPLIILLSGKRTKWRNRSDSFEKRKPPEPLTQCRSIRVLWKKSYRGRGTEWNKSLLLWGGRSGTVGLLKPTGHNGNTTAMRWKRTGSRAWRLWEAAEEPLWRHEQTGRQKVGGVVLLLTLFPADGSVLRGAPGWIWYMIRGTVSWILLPILRVCHATPETV